MNMLFVILYILISAIFTRAFKGKYGFLLNPHFLFTWFWSFCASLTVSFGYMGLISVSPQIHLYSLLFLFSFDFFSWFLFTSGSKKYVQDSCKEVLKLSPLNKRLVFFEVIALLLYSRYFLLSLAALLAGNATQIRTEIYFAQEDTFFTRLIPSAVLSAVVNISLYLFYKTKKKWYMVNAVLIVLIQSITSMGRGALLSFIIVNALLLLLDKHKIKLKSKPILIGIVAIFFLTVFGRESDIIKSFVLYFSGSFAFLDYIISNPQNYGLDQHHYGLLTFSLVTEPLLYILKVIGVTTAKIPSYWINQYVQDFVDIGNSNTIISFNNNTTALLPFLLDFGTIGIVVGAAFLAFLSVISYTGYMSGSPFSSLIYIYIIRGLFTATMSYQFLMGVTPFVIISCFYLIMKGNYRHEHLTNIYIRRKSV